MGSAAAVRHRDLIITLAARHKLPAVYWDRIFVAAGGLMSYGPNLIDVVHVAATSVKRSVNFWSIIVVLKGLLVGS
jgi:putative ABC transport system substrate-binding protein